MGEVQRYIHPITAPLGTSFSLCSDLEGTKDGLNPSTDSPDSCPKKSAGEQDWGDTGLGCAPHPHPEGLWMTLDWAETPEGPSQAQLPSVTFSTCRPKRGACRCGASREGVGDGGSWQGIHPILHTRNHMSISWGPSGPEVPALGVTLSWGTCA